MQPGPTEGVVPGHVLGAELARGGMGIVYQAREISPSRPVAIKMLLPHLIDQPTMKERFRQEAQAAAGLEHPGILPVYRVGESQGMPWFSMKLVTGGTLAARKARLLGNWRGVAQIVAAAAAAVQHAHERGVLHRDLKPANILFDEAETLFISDFGLARVALQDESTAGLTQSLQMLGTPAYLAPEVAAGSMKAATTASDIYALGAILYELICGQTPFQADSIQELLRKIVDERVPSLRGKSLTSSAPPSDLLAITEKCLEKNPAARYASAGALAQDLQSWLDGRTVIARPVGMGGQLQRWAQRRPAVAGLTAALMLGTITGVLLQWHTIRRLQHSLDDVDARVEFMTRELPMSLAPVGRLDLLDTVFQNVAEHYATDPSTDQNQLARQADFLTQWSQILRPRGQVKEALQRLEQALSAAQAACAGSGALPIEIVRARVLAGWRMGEALIEDRQFSRAETVLGEAQAFAAARPSDDLRFRVLMAQLTLEFAYLEMQQDHPAKALPPAQDSLRQWAVLRPRLQQEIGSPHYQLALVVAVQIHSSLAEIHDALKAPEASQADRLSGLEASGNLLALMPDNAQFLTQRLESLIIVAQGTQTTAAQKQTYYEEADQQAKLLMGRDPGNLQWRAWGMRVAKELAMLAAAAQNPAQERAWVLIVAERALPLYRTYATDLRYVRARATFGIFCGNYFLSHHEDWSLIIPHFDAAIRALKLISELEPSTANREKFAQQKQALFEGITKVRGSEEAAAWLADLQK